MATRSWPLSGQSLWARYFLAVFGKAPSSGRRGKRRRTTPLRTFLPAVEVLEARLAPATLTWTGHGTTGNWSEAANWSTGKAPTAADTVVFNATSAKNATVDAAFA